MTSKGHEMVLFPGNSGDTVVFGGSETGNPPVYCSVRCPRSQVELVLIGRKAVRSKPAEIDATYFPFLSQQSSHCVSSKVCLPSLIKLIYDPLSPAHICTCLVSHCHIVYSPFFASHLKVYPSNTPLFQSMLTPTRVNISEVQPLLGSDCAVRSVAWIGTRD